MRPCAPPCAQALLKLAAEECEVLAGGAEEVSSVPALELAAPPPPGSTAARLADAARRLLGDPWGGLAGACRAALHAALHAMSRGAEAEADGEEGDDARGAQASGAGRRGGRAVWGGAQSGAPGM